ncbi:MAG: sigma-70 family RNA polymerase sigma factor [Bacteroidota bacterium]
MAIDEKELIQNAQRGDVAAYEKLIYRYDRHILSIAASYVNDPDDAKDIYQDVLLRVYKGLPKFQMQSEFSTWLYRITTNVCLTYKAQSKRRAHVSLDKEFEHDDEDSHTLLDTLADDSATDQQLLDTEIRMQVESAMKHLSPQQKMVFTLRHYQGYKLKEIAKIMDCAEGTVKKYLFTATQRMREQLKDIYE